MERVRLPADIELEDKLAFGLTAKQLLLLAATALAAYGTYIVIAAVAPVVVAAAAAAPLALVGTLLSLGRLEALPADRLALAALRHLRSPRRRVLAPEGIAPPFPKLPASPRVAPLELPVRAILRSGLVELAGGSFALLLRASGAAFSLRGTEEQAALVEAFGRYLNALVDPIQIVVRSEPVQLESLLAQLHDRTGLLPPALRRAAEAHLRFLGELAARESVRRREILLVLITLRARAREIAEQTLARRAGEAGEILRAAGVDLHPLDGEQAAALLARCLDQPGPPPGASLDGVVRAC